MKVQRFENKRLEILLDNRMNFILNTDTRHLTSNMFLP